MIFSEWDKLSSILIDVKVMLNKNGLEESIIIYEKDSKYLRTIKEICNIIILLFNDTSIWEKKK